MPSIFNTIALLVFGFVILIKGADILVKGSSSIASRLGLSKWVIGVVIVGMGTSLPEFAISLASAIDGSSVGVGNIIGSNIANTLLILGILALFVPMAIKETWIKKDFLFASLSVVFVGLLAFLPVLGNRSFLGITRPEGFVIFLVFGLWMWYVTRKKDNSLEEEINERALTFLGSVTYIIFGTAGVFFGGEWIVEGARTIALSLGASEMLIGLTIVAVGTSLPEFVVSLTALRSGSRSMALGNLIGSNIFNLIGILGITSLLRSIQFPDYLILDMIVALLSMVLLTLMVVFFGRRYELERWNGLVLILAYVAYMIFIIIRG